MKYRDGKKVPMYGILMFDGGSRPNPGPSSSAWVIRDEDNNLLSKGSKYLGIKDCNFAEYMALLLGMEAAWNVGLTHMLVQSDSQLVIRQMTGEYRVRDAMMKTLNGQARVWEKRFEEITWEWVRREFNSEADEMCSICINLKESETW